MCDKEFKEFVVSLFHGIAWEDLTDIEKRIANALMNEQKLSLNKFNEVIKYQKRGFTYST